MLISHLSLVKNASKQWRFTSIPGGKTQRRSIRCRWRPGKDTYQVLLVWCIWCLIGKMKENHPTIWFYRGQSNLLWSEPERNIFQFLWPDPGWVRRNFYQGGLISGFSWCLLLHKIKTDWSYIGHLAVALRLARSTLCPIGGFPIGFLGSSGICLIWGPGCWNLNQNESEVLAWN